jgi:hypothetical protein
VVAGEGSIVAGLFTAPALITVPYSVVKCTVAGVVSGYSIIHLSDHARQSNWAKLKVFDFEVIRTEPATVYANGLQQAKVLVRVSAIDADGKEVELSDSEKRSVRLVSADGKNPLPEVGEGGVPEGGKWHYTESENPLYLPFPHRSLAPVLANAENQPAKLWTKDLFVQCHDIGNLKVAARLMSDNNQPFYTNALPEDGEPNNKVITLYAVAPDKGEGDGLAKLTFGDHPDNYPTRVEGHLDNGVDLNTVDYYYLKLLIHGVQVGIKSLDFDGHSSIVRWESNTMLEDVHSITAYAVPDDKDGQGNTVLHFDEVLWRRLGRDTPLPSQVVNPRYPVPEGEVLISLHRRELWRYEKYVQADFDKELKLIVRDKYGSQHRVIISFDGVNRNRLVIK